jgi:RNA polymerase sigma-70 factor (ECF subfamily)
MNPRVESSDPDDDLVRAAQRGDRHAFGLLYDRYARMVHGILLARVPFSVAEDLLQDVFLQALPRMATLRDTTRFPGWLAAIARNAANDHHRHTKRQQVELNEEAIGPDSRQHSHDASRCSQARTEAQAVLEAIRSLPDTYRETLILRLVEGLTGPEIAERTGLTHGSVRVNLHRGMQQLREILGQRSLPAGGGNL